LTREPAPTVPEVRSWIKKECEMVGDVFSAFLAYQREYLLKMVAEHAILLTAVSGW
jgi:hypothetical protein